MASFKIFKHFKFKQEKNPNPHKPKKRMKSFLHTNILPHVTNLAYALADLKCLLLDLFARKKPARPELPTCRKFAITKQNKNKIAAFIRLHLRWSRSSSHVAPVTESSRMYQYDHDDNAYELVISAQEDNKHGEEDRETEYLQWLEEGGITDDDQSDQMNEIDRLAEEFIANCHRKFMLEKQESYRRYQEMMARSV